MKNIENMIITSEKRIYLKSYTPNEYEWSQLKSIASDLGIGLTISPERGYRAAPAMQFAGVTGSIQKHITGWKVKENMKFEHGIVKKGVVCKLEKGMFITSNNEESFEIPKELTKQYLKPQFSFFLIIDNRKIDLNECEKIISQEPTMKELIVKAFFNKEFYTK